MREVFLVAIWLFIATDVLAVSEAYEDTLTGKRCSESKSSGELYCEYKVGDDLEFSIEGIGTPYTGISFVRANHSGDYYAQFGLLHGCVTIKHGRRTSTLAGRDYAFVSPKNGKVYRDWEDCKKAL